MMEKGRIFTGKGIATFSIFGRITRAFANLIIFGHRQCIGGDGQDISLHILALGHILHFRDFFQMGVVPVSITILILSSLKCMACPRALNSDKSCPKIMKEALSSIYPPPTYWFDRICSNNLMWKVNCQSGLGNT